VRRKENNNGGSGERQDYSSEIWQIGTQLWHRGLQLPENKVHPISVCFDSFENVTVLPISRFMIIQVSLVYILSTLPSLGTLHSKAEDSQQGNVIEQSWTCVRFKEDYNQNDMVCLELH
jgi:hypothetical protein